MAPPRPDRVLERKSDGLSVTEAAERLGVHAQTIYAWIRNGSLPVTKFGNVGRIHPDDLAEKRSTS